MWVIRVKARPPMGEAYIGRTMMVTTDIEVEVKVMVNIQVNDLPKLCKTGSAHKGDLRNTWTCEHIQGALDLK